MYGEPVREMLAWMKVLVLTALIILGTRQFLFEPVIVEGGSMQPTYHQGDKLVLWKITKIDHQDTVVFIAPNGDRFIKRVIGIPGDRIELLEGQLYLNGVLLEEPYLRGGLETGEENQYEPGEFIVPPASFYVLGDNRNNSTDSRIIGFVREQDVIGEVKFRFAPLSDFGPVD